MCPFDQQLEAYHDGELSAAQRVVIEKHLLECSDCAHSLRRLQAMSQLFASSVLPKISQISRYRLHHKVDAAMDGGLLRFAWAMSGIAASVLLVGLFWLMRVNDTTQAAASVDAPPWVSVSLATDHDPVVRDAATPAAQWYLADASSRSDEISQQ